MQIFFHPDLRLKVSLTLTGGLPPYYSITLQYVSARELLPQTHKPHKSLSINPVKPTTKATHHSCSLPPIGTAHI